MRFEWDTAKAAANRRKHRVSFEEASTVFDPAMPVIFEDLLHSDVELRFTAVGFSDKARLLTVSFVRRDGSLRIISARLSSGREQEFYGEAKGQES